MAVAVLGERLHDRVVKVSTPEAEDGEVGAGLALLGDIGLQPVGVADADVEIAVGGQKDAGDFVVGLHAFGDLIGEFQPLGPGGGATGCKVVQRRPGSRRGRRLWWGART